MCLCVCVCGVQGRWVGKWGGDLSLSNYRKSVHVSLQAVYKCH